MNEAHFKMVFKYTGYVITLVQIKVYYFKFKLHSLCTFRFTRLYDVLYVKTLIFLGGIYFEEYIMFL